MAGIGPQSRARLSWGVMCANVWADHPDFTQDTALRLCLELPHRPRLGPSSFARPTARRSADLRPAPSEMSTLRQMKPADLLNFAPCNLDPLTETYHLGFYLEYLAKWPFLCFVLEGLDGHIEGYREPHLAPSPLPSTESYRACSFLRLLAC